jgi:hypothetical protein
MSEEQGFRNIPGVPMGWELVHANRRAIKGEWYIDDDEAPQLQHLSESCFTHPIVRKIEKPAQYRPFANGAEYFANRQNKISVDWNREDGHPGFYTVVSANNSFLWVAIGDVIERFDWLQAFQKIKFRHIDNSTSPFGVKIDES